MGPTDTEPEDRPPASAGTPKAFRNFRQRRLPVLSALLLGATAATAIGVGFWNLGRLNPDDTGSPSGTRTESRGRAPSHEASVAKSTQSPSQPPTPEPPKPSEPAASTVASSEDASAPPNTEEEPSGLPGPLPKGLELAEDCKHPEVLIASGRAKGDEKPRWAWTTQAWLAYADLFPPLRWDKYAWEYPVRFFERTSSTEGDVRTLQLFASCTSVEVCHRFASVVRQVLPGSRARPVCASEPPDGGWLTGMEPAELLRVVATPGEDSASAERHCTRWAACMSRFHAGFQTERGLECLKRPSNYREQRRCATASTCYDVVECAATRPRRPPEFLSSADIETQVELRAAFLSRDKPLDSLGGDPLTADLLHSLNSQQLLESGGTETHTPDSLWTIAPIAYSASDEDDSRGQTLFKQASARQSLLLLRPGLLPLETELGEAHGEFDNIHWFAFHSLEAPQCPLFDFDGDGNREVAVYEVWTYHSASSRRRLSLWTFDGKAIRPYRASTGLPTVGCTDADEDGRPDLLLDTRDRMLCRGGAPDGEECPDGLHSSMEPDALAHSLPNGTFSTTDAVARKGAADATEP